MSQFEELSVSEQCISRTETHTSRRMSIEQPHNYQSEQDMSGQAHKSRNSNSLNDD